MVRTCNAAIAFVAMASAALAGASAIVPPAGAPRLQGEVAPPQGELSLWYRQPAADRPMTPRPAGPAASAEWVRALPVGNGRLGAMVFGGVVHERLQLNEDTLWAGRPYDPVNPEAKDGAARGAAPAGRRRYADAATLASAEGDGQAAGPDAVPDAGRSQADVPRRRRRRGVPARSGSRHGHRARVVHGGDVTFAREVFASAPDQVIVVRLTANRPGRISFEARLQTPQRATVEATGDGDLVMRGVNGDGRGATADGQPMTGALRFEARVRVLAHGRHAHRLRRRRRGPRRRRGDAAHRGRDELPDATTTSAAIRPRPWPRRSTARPPRPSTRCAPRTSATTSGSSAA